MKVALSHIAAVAECIEAVDMRKVSRYRRALRRGAVFPPISLRPLNRTGFHIINDGNHRTLAHLLEGKTVIEGEVDDYLTPMPLSWRWPRVAPVHMTLTLFKASQ